MYFFEAVFNVKYLFKTHRHPKSLTKIHYLKCVSCSSEIYIECKTFFINLFLKNNKIY